MLKYQILAMWDDNAGREVCVTQNFSVYSNIDPEKLNTGRAEWPSTWYSIQYTSKPYQLYKLSVSNRGTTMIKQVKGTNRNNLSVVLMKQVRRKHWQWFSIWVQTVTFVQIENLFWTCPKQFGSIEGQGISFRSVIKISKTWTKKNNPQNCLPNHYQRNRKED